jgi:hypothetical protein
LATVDSSKTAPGLQGPNIDENDVNTNLGRSSCRRSKTIKKRIKGKGKAPVEEEEAESPLPNLEPSTRHSKKHQTLLRAQHPGRSTNQLSTTSRTDVTRSSKRRQEEGLKLDTMREIKRRKTAVAKEFRRLAKRLEANNDEDSMLDAAINELTKNMSRKELVESFKALMVESDEWTTDNEET